MGNGFKVIDGGRGAGCGFLTDAEIEGFLADGLDDARLADFAGHQQQGCAPCALFAADLRTYRDVLHDGPLASERRRFDEGSAELRERLRRTLDESRPRSSGRKLPLWLLSAAASIVFVAFLGFQLLGPQGPAVTLPDGTSFGYGVPAAPDRLRDGGEFARGRAAYATEDWAAAAVAFAAVGPEDPRFVDARFYAGSAALLDGEPERAIELLEQARSAAAAEGRDSDRIVYYLALAKVETGDVEAAIGLLEGIEPDADAATLLDALRP